MTSPAPHVFTLTGNLLAERTLVFETWTPGRTQRAVAASFQAGGKGVNVAKMLARLGVPATALVFSGGAPGAECEAWLAARALPHRAFASLAPTRTGTVVRTVAGTAPETTFLGPDAAPDAAALAACAAFLDAQPDGRVLALCGSFPGWSGPDFEPLRAALLRWLARGVLVADTYGPPLVWAAAHPLALIKINADELRSLAAPEAAHSASPAPPAPRAPAATSTLVASPPGPTRRWVVSDGPRRVVVWDNALAAEVTPPAVAEISATGSGDVLLACLLQALFIHRRPLVDAVRYALPYASANAAHPGIAEFPEPPGAEKLPPLPPS